MVYGTAKNRRRLSTSRVTNLLQKRTKNIRVREQREDIAVDRIQCAANNDDHTGFRRLQCSKQESKL